MPYSPASAIKSLAMGFVPHEVTVLIKDTEKSGSILYELKVRRPFVGGDQPEPYTTFAFR
jgi:hypothetical protein